MIDKSENDSPCHFSQILCRCEGFFFRSKVIKKLYFFSNRKRKINLEF